MAAGAVASAVLHAVILGDVSQSLGLLDIIIIGAVRLIMI